MYLERLLRIALGLRLSGSRVHCLGVKVQLPEVILCVLRRRLEGSLGCCRGEGVAAKTLQSQL